MNPSPKHSAKEHYQQLRHLSCEQLWADEVPAFDRGTARERVANVAVVRAVGVVFSESGTPEQREAARQWLQSLLHDPEEKVRRYAMTALPKLGADEREETALLALLEKTRSTREKQSLGRTLEKIGGAATLAAAAGNALPRTAQKAAANVARQEAASTIRLDAALAAPRGTRIHLRTRTGLEGILADELSGYSSKFRLAHRTNGLLVIEPRRAFSLADVFALRCFSSASLVLGTARRSEEIAPIIAAPATQKLLTAATAGPIRYRLEFAARGHQRGAVRKLGDHVFALAPALLNDSRDATWQITIHEIPTGLSVELSPRLRPDPRFAYRRRDVPAASHPPLAAAMVRLAGQRNDERVWDPFCGSGLELIERSLRGGVRHLFGTDLSAEAIDITRENLAAAGMGAIPATLACLDFRDYATLGGLRARSLSLIVTNPPLGRRVPIPNLPGLIADLFAAATELLEPGGRLVFTNPTTVRPATRALPREFRQRIDLGGFHCHLEKYVRA
jgi:23S rRNA G2445 N2-methylase RlmL